MQDSTPEIERSWPDMLCLAWFLSISGVESCVVTMYCKYLNPLSVPGQLVHTDDNAGVLPAGGDLVPARAVRPQQGIRYSKRNLAPSI